MNRQEQAPELATIEHVELTGSFKVLSVELFRREDVEIVLETLPEQDPDRG